MERELRDELANSVSREASDADRARIGELEKAEAELRVEVSRCAYVISPEDAAQTTESLQQFSCSFIWIFVIRISLLHQNDCGICF